MPDSVRSLRQPGPPPLIFEAARLEVFIDPVGRLAWDKAEAPAAADVLAQNGYAIVRVEVWCICNEDTYSAVIPFVDGLYGRFDWRQEEAWTPERESWESYCIRCRDWALSQLPRMNYEPKLMPDYGPEKMRVHFETLAQSDYA